jgi:Txe/YoeB family toxin of Txe-Axe toxin-antitoxin module
MTEPARIIRVRFADRNLFKAYCGLEKGTAEERSLFSSLQQAINDIRKNPLCGIRIPHKLTPRKYTAEYGIEVVWKYNLPRGWRLIYSIAGNEVEIISVILEWFDYKEYARRFGYKAN